MVLSVFMAGAFTRYTWLYIEYSSFLALVEGVKSAPTSSFLAHSSIADILFKFIFCHYAVPFLNLTTNLILPEL